MCIKIQFGGAKVGGEKGIDQGLTCRDFEQFDRWSDMKKLIAI